MSNTLQNIEYIINPSNSYLNYHLGVVQNQYIHTTEMFLQSKFWRIF